MTRMTELNLEKSRVSGVFRPVSAEQIQAHILEARRIQGRLIAGLTARTLRTIGRLSGLTALGTWVWQHGILPLQTALRQRHTVAVLQGLDDRMLRDIGIERHQVREVVASLTRDVQPRHSMWTRFAKRFAQNRLRRTTIRELQALSDRELADVGLCRGDIPSVADTLARRAVEAGPVQGRARSVGSVSRRVDVVFNPLRQWQLSRKAAGEMARMDHKLLADIGYVKGDIDWVPEVLADRRLNAANNNGSAARATGS